MDYCGVKGVLYYLLKFKILYFPYCIIILLLSFNKYKINQSGEAAEGYSC